MLTTSRTTNGVHHVHAADYLASGRSVCGRDLDVRRQCATLNAEDLQELLIHAGATPTGLCSRCEAKLRQDAKS